MDAIRAEVQEEEIFFPGRSGGSEALVFFPFFLLSSSWEREIVF